MSDTNEFEQDQIFIKSVIQNLIGDIELAIALEELLEASAGRREHSKFREIEEVFTHTQIAPTFNIIQLLLKRELTLCLTRIHDGPSQDRASLGEVFRKLAKMRTRNLFLSEHSSHIQLQYSRDAAAWLSDLEDKWNTLKTQDCADDLKKLFDARNVFIAHTLLKEPELPTYSALFSLVERTAGIVGDLGILSGIYLNGFEASRKIKRNRALIFWNTLIIGGHASDLRKD